MNNFLFQPNNGGPNYTNWAVLAASVAGLGYFAMQVQKPSTEINYMEFVHSYLAKGIVSMITLCEDGTGGAFKYRAVIETIDGQKVHLVLPQVENFLLKLDMAQREMGKDPS